MATLLFGWIVAGMVKLLARLALSQKPGESELHRKVVGAAAFCGLAGFLVHGLADFGWRLPVNLVYCATLLAICVSNLEPEKTPDTSL